MKIFLKIIALHFFFIMLYIGKAGCQEYVRVDGSKFMIGNEPYYYVGVNFWQGAYLAADLIEGGKERLIRELDLMKEHGITNLRVMASSEKSTLKMSVTPAFQVSPGEYHEKLLTGMDFLLEEMAKRDMRAIMCLSNYWQWSGGFAQYINWATGIPIIDPDKNNDWHGFMKYSGNFYKNKEAKEMYFTFVRFILERKNTINHIWYKEDPTIMSWEIANEPRPHPESLNKPELLPDYYQFMDTTAKIIHEIAPKHLVTIGSEGLAGSLFDSAIYVNSHSLPSIDYITFHLWPKNWGWFIASNPEKTLPLTLKNSSDYFKRHVQFAEQINKPTVLEEFGIGRDGELYEESTSVTARNEFLKLLFKHIEEDASLGKPIAGTNIWAWGGEGRPSNKEAIWEEGVDFTGDPPQEPQGLNSIYDTDISTLEIIKNHHKNLESISNLVFKSLNQK